MARAVSSAMLGIRLDRAKKREAAILAKKLSTAPKPYVKQPAQTIVKAQAMTDANIFVEIPIPSTTWTKIPAQSRTLLGISLATTALTGTQVLVGFTGNHKKVLRVVVYEGTSAPASKITSWGTRVVKKIVKSMSFPVGGSNLDAVIAAFKVQFAPTGAMNNLMGTENGYALLKLGNAVLAKVGDAAA